MASVAVVNSGTALAWAAALPGRAGWSLARRFLVAHFALVFIGVALTGAWIGGQVEASVLDRTASVTALYVDSVITPHLQNLANSQWLSDDEVNELDRLVKETSLGQGVVVFKIWSPDGTVLYSPDRTLIGRQFPTTDEFHTALQGQVIADMSNLSEPENERERALFSRLIEVYAPVLRDNDGELIAVNEFYMLPGPLEAEIADARLRAWLIVGAFGIGLYLLSAGIIKQASDTIARQHGRLQEQVVELASLHERVMQAANRTTALNEQALRRISADLHDGPGQVLALASLRLDALGAHYGTNPDVNIVQDAVRDALSEIRSISSGLRLPELEVVPVGEVLARTITQHERRTGTTVTRVFERLPQRAPLAVKIAMVRTLNEALSNATRHAPGAAVSVRAWVQGGYLYIEVADEGPGFEVARAPDPDTGHLGLAGMRERAELLGGKFSVRTAPGAGTAVRACWPLQERCM